MNPNVSDFPVRVEVVSEKSSLGRDRYLQETYPEVEHTSVGRSRRSANFMSDLLQEAIPHSYDKDHESSDV